MKKPFWLKKPFWTKQRGGLTEADNEAMKKPHNAVGAIILTGLIICCAYIWTNNRSKAVFKEPETTKPDISHVLKITPASVTETEIIDTNQYSDYEVGSFANVGNKRLICGIVYAIKKRLIDPGYKVEMYFKKGMANITQDIKVSCFFDFYPAIRTGQKVVIAGIPTSVRPIFGQMVATIDKCKVLWVK